MEEIRKNNWFVSFLCIILALACVVAIFSISSDETIKDPADSSQDGNIEDSDNGENDAEKPPQTNDYYVLGDIGYRTVGNVTSFFLVCENPFMNVDYPNYYTSTWEIWIDKDLLIPVGDYVVDVRYSTDYGLTWASMPDYMEIETSYGLHELTTNKPIYISYTFISNCESPDTELFKLQKEVFTGIEDLNEGFGNIYGNIIYYKNFPVVVQNTPIVPDDL